MLEAQILRIQRHYILSVLLIQCLPSAIMLDESLIDKWRQSTP